MKFPARLISGAVLLALLLPMAVAEEATVVSAVSTLSYTFIELARAGKPVWLATDVIQLKPGDQIRFEPGLTMTNFRSNDLERTFPNMSFVEKISVIPQK